MTVWCWRFAPYAPSLLPLRFCVQAPLVLGFHLAWLSTTVGLAAVGTFVLDRTQHLAWWRAQELQLAEERIRACYIMYCRLR